MTIPEQAERIIDKWAGEALARGYASSWHYGELWSELRALLGVQRPEDVARRVDIARALYDHEFKSNRVEYPSYDDPRTTSKCRDRFLARADVVLALPQAGCAKEGNTAVIVEAIALVDMCRASRLGVPQERLNYGFDYSREQCIRAVAQSLSAPPPPVEENGWQAIKETWCPFCKKKHVGGDTCMGHHP